MDAECFYLKNYKMNLPKLFIKIISHKIFINISIILIYILVSYFIFNDRILNIFSGYGMSDVDTDGTLWYYWARIFSSNNNIFFNNNNQILSYPFGYDFSFIPFSTFIYEIIIVFIKLLGNNIDNIITVSNIFSILTYPITAYSFYLLFNYISNNKFASFFVGLFATFSFHFILMSRGALSLNQVYFVPLFLFSLFYFLKKKSFVSLLLSSLIFAILFGYNAYWAFFSGLFSIIIIVLYSFLYREINKKNVLHILFYYFSLIGITLSLNFQFIIQNSYNLDKTSVVRNTLRVIIPQNELLHIRDYFLPPLNSYIYQGKMITHGDTFLGYILLFFAISGVFFLKRKDYFKNYLIFFVCFLASILFSSRIPGLTKINDIYFNYFGIFRAVSRLSMFASFFLSLMSGYVLVYLYDKYFRNKTNISKLIFVASMVIISFLIIIEGINNDGTFKKITKIEGLKQTYEAVKNNPDIKIIAQYPMWLSNGENGNPANYQLMGQIIHNKTLVSGASPFNENQLGFYESVKDIENFETIDILKKYKVDTIIVNKNLFIYGDNIVNYLKKDKRLTYIGEYKGEMDDGDNNPYISVNELSRDIVVFHINQ